MYVELLITGERVKFGWHGCPSPETSILLFGSGRSGTTWITDVLCALPGVQQIFEPLFPPWNERVRQITGWDKRDPYIRGIYLRPEEEYPEWEDLWHRILTGKFRNYWTDYKRTSWFPNRFLIKEVRANLMLGWLYRKFQPSILYIMRHPCAVVYSRLAAPQPWHADVQDALRQEKLVEDYLKPWAAEIERETDRLGAHAVWWTVENLVALRQLQGIPHALLFYEDLILHPHEVLENLLPWLGVERIPKKVFDLLPQPSRMSNHTLAYRDAQDRLSRWQTSLSVEEQMRILVWAERLGVNAYDTQPHPRIISSIYA
ncbi:MAG: hypothetical protein OHK003_30860 [Anaerolineales bacterium]